jgi:TolA-binding protein
MGKPLIFLATIVAALIVSSCARKTAPELLQAAAEAEAQKDYNQAVAHYSEFVARFHTEAAAESVQFRIALIYSNDLRDGGKAVEAYQSFNKQFPNSPEAPTALFMSGYLQANELHQLDAARSTYEQFLAEYPEHSLAVSARFELETLGKDPGEVIHPRISASEGAKNTSQSTKKQ